jgi:hypothetical protein
MSTAAAQTPPGWRIWFAILGAPFAWTMEETLGWLLASGSCPAGSPAGTGGTVTVLPARALILATAAVALVISLAALWISIDAWRRSRDPSILSIHAFERPDFLAAAALLISLLFTLGVLMMSAVIFVLPTCQIMR